MSNPLSEVSILLNLRISQWLGEVADDKALAAVAQAFKGDTSHDKYRKSLFVTDALRPIHKCAGRVRTHFYRNTFNWTDGGSRLVPSMAFREFGRDHSRLNSEFDQEVDRFVAEYPEHKREAHDRKGDLYREADYPDVDEVQGKFGISLIALPFPTTTDFRVQAPEDIITELRSQIETSLKDVQNTVASDVKTRIRVRLEKLRDALASEKRFSQSLFDELALIVDMAEHMQSALPNLLSHTLQGVKTELLAYSAEQVRNSDSLKAQYQERVGHYLLHV